MAQDGKPAFSWNFVDGGAEYLTAHVPVKFSLHAKNTIHTGTIPKPEIIEADFNCTGGSVAAQRPLTGAAPFVFHENELDTGLTKGCKTADGKSGADIAATAKGPMAGAKDIMNNKAMTDEEKVAAMAKSMGIESDGKEEESPAQKARREQCEQTGGCK